MMTVGFKSNQIESLFTLSAIELSNIEEIWVESAWHTFVAEQPFIGQSSSLFEPFCPSSEFPRFCRRPEPCEGKNLKSSHPLNQFWTKLYKIFKWKPPSISYNQ